MDEFIKNNATALFTILGVVIGIIGSFMTASFVANRESKLKLREKILDKRIESHERIISLSHSLRAMFPIGGLDAQGELARIPSILATKKSFDDWMHHYFNTMMLSSNWLGANLIHELNLLQDYQVNLQEFLRNVPEGYYIQVGQILRLDFIYFSERIERLAYNFFINDLEKLRISPLPEWHKYPIKETTKRLESTDLYKRRAELNALASH
jgi:hypothetical protein